MTTENKTPHNPLPWRFEDKYKDDPKRVVDADGVFVFGDSCGPAKRNGELIVNAVNGQKEQDEYIAYLEHDVVPKLEKERDALRELLRRMLPFIERSRDRLCDGQRLHGTEGDFSPAIHELTEIIIEADAAIGREADDGQE